MTRPKTRITLCALALMGLIAGSAPSHAYRMWQSATTGRVTGGYRVTCNASGGFAHWEIRSIPWYINLNGQSSDKITAIDNAMWSWTNVANTNYFPHYAGQNSAGFTTDGQNTFTFGTNSACTGSCIGLTALVHQSGQVIVESDILFNTQWNFYTNGQSVDTEAVAAHELGHSLGIHHTEVTSTTNPPTMSEVAALSLRTLEVDDINALLCSENRYPVPPVCTTDPVCEQFCVDQKFSCDGGGLQDANEQARCDNTYNECMSTCTVCN